MLAQQPIYRNHETSLHCQSTYHNVTSIHINILYKFTQQDQVSRHKIWHFWSSRGFSQSKSTIPQSRENNLASHSPGLDDFAVEQVANTIIRFLGFLRVSSSTHSRRFFCAKHFYGTATMWLFNRFTSLQINLWGKRNRKNTQQLAFTQFLEHHQSTSSASNFINANSNWTPKPAKT